MTRPPAGFYPANEFVRHVVMAGCEIVCTACSGEGRLPLPRQEGYSAAVEDFLERHRPCRAAGTAPDPSFRRSERGAA